MRYEWTIGRRGFWKPYFYELRLDGALIEQKQFWTLTQVMLAIATHQAS